MAKSPPGNSGGWERVGAARRVVRDDAVGSSQAGGSKCLSGEWGGEM